MKRRYLTKYSSIESFTTARPSIENPTVCLIKGNGEKDVKFEYSCINDDEFAEELRRILGRRNINRDTIESMTNSDFNRLGSYYIIDNILLDDDNIGTNNVDYSNQVGTWVEINVPIANLNNEELFLSWNNNNPGDEFISEGSTARGAKGGDSELTALPIRLLYSAMDYIPTEYLEYVTLNPSGKTPLSSSDKLSTDRMVLDLGSEEDFSYGDAAAYLSTICPQEFVGDDITGINILPLFEYGSQNINTTLINYINRKTRYVMDNETNVYVQLYSTTFRAALQRILASNLSEFKKLSSLTNFADGDWDLGLTSFAPFSSLNEIIYLPEQMNYLPSMCFQGCTGLRELHLLGIESIGVVAFGWDQKKNIQEIHFYKPIQEIGNHYPFGNIWDWAEETPIKFIFHYSISNGNYLVIDYIQPYSDSGGSSGDDGPIKGAKKGGDSESRDYDPYDNFLGKNIYFFVPDDVVWETRDYFNWFSDRIFGLSDLINDAFLDEPGEDVPPVLDDGGNVQAQV